MTKFVANPMTEEQDNQMFDQFKQSFQAAYNRLNRGQSVVSSHAFPLVMTDIAATLGKDYDSVFDAFMAKLPEVHKDRWNCNTCRRFINSYAGLAVIDPEDPTHLIPVLWDPSNVDEIPAPLLELVTFFANRVSAAQIVEPFYTNDVVLGNPTTGNYTHIALKLPATEDSFSLDSPTKKTSEYLESYKNLRRFIGEMSAKTMKTASGIFGITPPNINKAKQFAEQIKELQKLHDDFHSTKNQKVQKTILWTYILARYASQSNIRSSALGEFYADIEKGLHVETALKLFTDRVDPLNYMRPTADATAGNAARADELVRELNLESALERRYASIEEIPDEVVLWRKKEKPLRDEKNPAGRFSQMVKAKEERSLGNQNTTTQKPAATMSWAGFVKNVMPHTDEIILDFSRARVSLGGLTTAVHADAEPLMKYDSLERRNPFAQYFYSQGIPVTTISNTGSNFVKIDMIVPGAHYWYTENPPIDSVLFVTSELHDVSDQSLRLFPENLRHELYEVRASMEQYSNSNSLTPLEDGATPAIVTHFNINEPFMVINYELGTTQKITITSWE